jgi:predicted amidohydrolase YtcJ
LRGDLTVRLRPYEISNAQMTTDMTPDNGDDVLGQAGIKIWVDGSPWIGNIDLSFPYLDTDATRTIGVTPGSCGCANYTREQLSEIVAAYFPRGWQMACHVRGDAGVDTLIVDGLFGPEHGERWMPCGSAVATGMRISLHNDPPVTPEEPLRNISVAATRIAPSGRVLGPEERLTVEQAIRAQTIDAAYQLFSDVVIGSLEVGKYADMVVLSADPRAVPPEQIADLEVQRTYLAGLQVYPK